MRHAFAHVEFGEHGYIPAIKSVGDAEVTTKQVVDGSSATRADRQPYLQHMQKSGPTCVDNSYSKIRNRDVLSATLRCRIARFATRLRPALELLLHSIAACLPNKHSRHQADAGSCRSTCSVLQTVL